jgi:hypothetical protein
LTRKVLLADLIGQDREAFADLFQSLCLVHVTFQYPLERTFQVDHSDEWFLVIQQGL